MNQDVIDTHALIYRLIHAHKGMNGPDSFLHALDLENNPASEQTVARMWQLVHCAINVTTNLVRVVTPEGDATEGWIMEPIPEVAAKWGPAHWTTARALVAKLNQDVDMVNDLLAASIADRCVHDATEALVGVLYVAIDTAARALRFAGSGRSRSFWGK